MKQKLHNDVRVWNDWPLYETRAPVLSMCAGSQKRPNIFTCYIFSYICIQIYSLINVINIGRSLGIFPDCVNTRKVITSISRLRFTAIVIVERTLRNTFYLLCLK